MKQLQGNVIGHGPTFLDRRRLLGTLGLVGFGLASGITLPARAQTKADNKPAAKISVSPPPADVNDLSMEVAALRTLYLLKAGPDQLGERRLAHMAQAGWYPSVTAHAKGCAQPPRPRQPAKVSKNYLKVLTELRAAFIVNQETRVNELSDQLEEVTKAEQPELDDTVEITDEARKREHSTWQLNILDANRIAMYIAAYGKDFPDPYFLIYKTIRADGKGTKPTPEQWKETRAFVIREVSWQVGGLDLKEQKKIGEQVAKLLDRAYPLSNEELKKEFIRYGVGLRGELNNITNQTGPTDILKHVLEQDIAELQSNPRLLPAIEARQQYLKKAGIIDDQGG